MVRAAAPAPIRADPDSGGLSAILRGTLHALYDGLWLMALLLAGPWLGWRCVGDRRFARMLRERLGAGLPFLAKAGSRPRILVHGVSVGEVKGALALVKGLERDCPGHDIVISATTDTGMEVARRLYPDCVVVRFPFDLTFVVDRFFARIDPACVVLVELEMWPNLLRHANRRGIPVAVVNGRITQRSFSLYRRLKSLLPFSRLSLVCVQDEEYAVRFRALMNDAERIVVTGNIKIDALQLGTGIQDPELLGLLGANPGQAVVVAGSTHEPEERLLVEAWRTAVPASRLVLVPRHPDRGAQVERDLQAIGQPVQRLSRLRAGDKPDPASPAVVDTIGELEAVYALADLVFVGGSLVPHGGQNMLEPAAQAKSTFYGPHVENFAQEARLLEAAGASLRIGGVGELAGALSALLGDRDRRDAMGRAGLAAVRSQQGATARTLLALESGLGLESPR